MSLQEKVLESYRKKYPKDTLKIISKKTGIQMTRVFRIFNGREMKLHEYESFQSLLDLDEQSPKTDLYSLYFKSMKELDHKDRDRINQEIERKVYKRKIFHMMNHVNDYKQAN